jgi:hypothetical protein
LDFSLGSSPYCIEPEECAGREDNLCPFACGEMDYLWMLEKPGTRNRNHPAAFFERRFNDIEEGRFWDTLDNNVGHFRELSRRKNRHGIRQHLDTGFGFRRVTSTNTDQDQAVDSAVQRVRDFAANGAEAGYPDIKRFGPVDVIASRSHGR